jgi:hypothetical protein
LSKSLYRTLFFISRYKLGTNIYQDIVTKNGEEKRQVVTIKKLAKGMRVNQIRNLNVYVGSKRQLEARLIIQKLPKKIADKRKRRLKENSKNTPSEQRLSACEYTLMMTNIKHEILNGDEILKTYGIRWQIEILFKGWKSVMKFGKIHPMKTDRFLCMLYGHLIWITLTMKITSWTRIIFSNKYKVELSELKAFKIINLYHHKILAIFHQTNFNLTELIQKILDALFFLAEKERKKYKGKFCSTNLFTLNNA